MSSMYIEYCTVLYYAQGHLDGIFPYEEGTLSPSQVRAWARIICEVAETHEGLLVSEVCDILEDLGPILPSKIPLQERLCIPYMHYISTLLETIDEVKENIPSGHYLKLCDVTSRLYECRKHFVSKLHMARVLSRATAMYMTELNYVLSLL